MDVRKWKFDEFEGNTITQFPITHYQLPITHYQSMSVSFTQIAPYYDILMRRVDYSGWVRYLEEIFERFGIKPKKILDLACGTGVPTLLLARQGYEVIGLDLSKEMLEVAREKVGAGLPRPYENRVRFIQADVRDFGIPEEVDAVVSFFDSFNYLLDEEDLQKSYSSAYRALRRGGFILFDMNTDFGLSHYWANGTEIREVDGLLSVWRNSYDKKRKIARLDLTLFVQSPSSPPFPALLPTGIKGDTGGFRVYRRVDEVHEERGYSPREIKELLQKVGFENVQLFKHLQFEPPARSTNRVMVVARKST